MKRTILLVPFLALAACTDGPLAPGVAPGAPLAAATSFDNSGGVTFSQDTGCTHDVGANTVNCTYTVQNLPVATVQVVTRSEWLIEYRCVHQKTGKTNKQHGAREGWLWVTSLPSPVMPVDGELTGESVMLVPPETSVVNLCSGNKGPYTAIQLLAAPTPVAWTIFAGGSLDEFADYWAELFGDFTD